MFCLLLKPIGATKYIEWILLAERDVIPSALTLCVNIFPYGSMGMQP